MRALIAASVAAGLPAGLLFAAVGYVFALPVLQEAEVFETGAHAAHLAGGAAEAHRLLWGLAGAAGLGCGLALVLTPLVRAVGRSGRSGRPEWRTGAAVGALAYLAVFLLPALVTLPGPPGVEHGPALGARQGAWVFSLLSFAAAWGAGTWARGRLARGGRGRWASGLGAGAAGLSMWAIGMGLFLALTGFAPGPEPALLPDTVVHQFGAAMALCNAILYATLGLLIPPALRRFCP